MECGHEPCTCVVIEEGEFCSDACATGSLSGLFCSCDHMACRASRVQPPEIV